MKTVKAWCVFCPYGKTLSIGETKKKAISNFLTIEYSRDDSDMYEWYIFESQEYRVVPVEIREVKDEQES